MARSLWTSPPRFPARNLYDGKKEQKEENRSIPTKQQKEKQNFFKT